MGYIKFKREAAMSQKMLNFDKESIKVIKGDTTIAVVVSGTLTIVGLPDEFFKFIFISLFLVLFLKMFLVKQMKIIKTKKQ